MSFSNDEAIWGDPFLGKKVKKITKKCRCHQSKNGKKILKWTMLIIQFVTSDYDWQRIGSVLWYLIVWKSNRDVNLWWKTLWSNIALRATCPAVGASLCRISFCSGFRLSNMVYYDELAWNLMGLGIFDRFGTKKSGLERDLVSKGNLPKHSRDFLDSQKNR